MRELRDMLSPRNARFRYAEPFQALAHCETEPSFLKQRNVYEFEAAQTNIDNHSKYTYLVFERVTKRTEPKGTLRK